MTSSMFYFAHWVQGRPKKTWPVRLEEAAVLAWIVEWLITKRLASVADVGPSAVIVPAATEAMTLRWKKTLACCPKM